MTQTQTNVNVVQPQTDETVKLVTVNELRDMLVARHGSAFASVCCEYDMLEVNERGQLKKMNKRDNPFIGGTLRKIAKTSIMVNFDYAASMERRTDGEETAKDGNWQQALCIGGHLTPLTVHKGDIETRPKADAEPRKDGTYKLADLEPILDDDDNVIFTVDEPRVYLRCEFRSSESHYEDGEGNEIDKAEVNPHLKKSSAPGPVDHHTVTLNNVTEMKIGGETYRIR